jgi:hypothetical protein
MIRSALVLSLVVVVAVLGCGGRGNGNNASTASASSSGTASGANADSLSWTVSGSGPCSCYVSHVTRVNRNAVTIRVGELEVGGRDQRKSPWRTISPAAIPFFSKLDVPGTLRVVAPGLAIDHQVEVLIEKSGALPEAARSQRKGASSFSGNSKMCVPPRNSMIATSGNIPI